MGVDLGLDEEQCPECGGDLAAAFIWRDWQTVAMIQDCQHCDGTGIADPIHIEDHYNGERA